MNTHFFNIDELYDLKDEIHQCICNPDTLIKVLDKIPYETRIVINQDARSGCFKYHHKYIKTEDGWKDNISDAAIDISTDEIAYSIIHYQKLRKQFKYYIINIYEKDYNGI